MFLAHKLCMAGASLSWLLNTRFCRCRAAGMWNKRSVVKGIGETRAIVSAALGVIAKSESGSFVLSCLVFSLVYAPVEEERRSYKGEGVNNTWGRSRE